MLYVSVTPILPVPIDRSFCGASGTSVIERGLLLIKPGRIIFLMY